MPQALALLARTMPGIPPHFGWAALVILGLLLTTAIIDARKGRVPDNLLLVALLITSIVHILAVSWTFAAHHLLSAFLTGLALYLVNEVWHRFQRHDAFGMGDAKWTAVAVAAFGLEAASIAWIIGAWLALIWMAVARLLKRKAVRVHFAPFLFVGLLGGLYWLRLRGH